MKNKIIVPDANVFTKLFHPEKDSHQAKAFFETCATTNSKLVVPELFKYEIAETTRYANEDILKTIKLFDIFIRSILTVASPNEEAWLLAEKIAQTGHPKSGYPSMYDSIYHSLAIQLDGVFLTADKKHFEKAKNFEHIQLLKDWDKIFIEGKE